MLRKVGFHLIDVDGVVLRKVTLLRREVGREEIITHHMSDILLYSHYVQTRALYSSLSKALSLSGASSWSTTKSVPGAGPKWKRRGLTMNVTLSIMNGTASGEAEVVSNVRTLFGSRSRACIVHRALRVQTRPRCSTRGERPFRKPIRALE